MIKTIIFSFLLLLISSAHGASALLAAAAAEGTDDPAALAIDSGAPARGGGGASARGVVVAPEGAAAADNRGTTTTLIQAYQADLEAALAARLTAQKEKIAALDCARREQIAREDAEHARAAALRRAADEQAAREAAERARDAARAQAAREQDARRAAERAKTVQDVLVTQHGKLGEIFGAFPPERLALEDIQAMNNAYREIHDVAGFEAANFNRVHRAAETFQNPLLLRTYQRNPLADDNRFLGIADCLSLPLPAGVQPLAHRVDLRDDAVVDRCADALAIVTNNRYLLPNLDQHDAVALVQLLDYINNNPAAQAQFEAVRNHRAGLDQLFHEARYGKSHSKQLLLAGAAILITGYAANRYYQYQMKRFNEDILSIKATVKDENKIRALIAERRKWKYFLPGGAKTFNNNVMKKLLPVESVTPTS